MNLLTSFEAIKYIDLARKQTAKSRSVQGFLCSILGLKSNTISAYHINMVKQLRQGNVILDAIDNAKDNGLTDEDIIENIRKNIRKTAAINYLDDELKSLIKSSVNTDASKKNEYLSCDDFSERIFHILVDTLIDQEIDKVKYGSDYKNADTFSYQDTLNLLDAKDGLLDDSESKEIKQTLSHLEKVSAAIYQEIRDKEKRYHALSLNKKLLSLGSDKDLPTYGDSDKDTLPMNDYFNLNNHLFIVGEGGIGKTTLLVNWLNELDQEDENVYIPIFLTLTKLKNKNMSPSGSYIYSALLEKISELIEKHEIKTDFNPYTYEQNLKKALSSDTAPKKILLMLDGFNEISNSAGSVPRDSIKKEIESLSSCSNVRLILTSRPFYEHHKIFPTLKHIYAKGINDTTLEMYLKDKPGQVANPSQLFTLLHNPLFLIMYLSNAEKGVIAKTRGGILYEYCNGIASDYTQLKLSKETDSLPEYTPILLDFVMPAIAAKMEMLDTFYLPLSEFDDIIENLESLTKPFDKLRDSHFNRHENRSTLTSYARAIINDGPYVIDVLTDGLSYLQQDSDGNLFFIHQYIKDYFASLFRLFTYRQGFVNTDDLYYEYAHSLMDIESFDLSKEVAAQSDICTIEMLSKLLKNCPDREDSNFIRNLITMLSTLNNNSLAGFTFNDLNLSTVSFQDYSFYDGTHSSIFNNCTFSENSFLTRTNANKLLRTLTMWNNRPALCEFMLYSTVAFIKISDIKTTLTLHADSFDFFNKDIHIDFSNMNEIMISKNNRHLVIFDKENNTEFFYVYNNSTHKFTIHKLPNDCKSTTYSFIENSKLAVICDLFNACVYDLNYVNEPNKIYDYEAGIIFDSTYRGMIDSYTLPLESFLNSVLGDWTTFASTLSVADVYSYNDYLILMFNALTPKKTPCIYSIKNNSIVSVTSEKFPAEAISYSVTSIKIHDVILYSFGESVFELNLSTLHIRRIVTLNDHNRFTGLGCNGSVLYIVTTEKIYDVDISTGEILNKYDTYLRDISTSYATNENSFAFAITNAEECFANIYRFDNHDLNSFTFEKSISLKTVTYLSNNRIAILYTQGYVNIVDSRTLQLLDVFRIPGNLEYIIKDYNEAKEQLAVLTYDSDILYRSDDKQVSLYIVDTTCNNSSSFIIIKTFSVLKTYYNVCFSLDGNLLFLAFENSIRVYRTDTYEELEPININTSVYCMKAYEGYIVAICYKASKYHETISTSDMTVIIDINSYTYKHSIYELIDRSTPELHAGYYTTSTQEERDKYNLKVDEHKKIYTWNAIKLCPNFYEVVYTDKPVDTTRSEETFKRFFRCTDHDYESDIYQDGILIRFSSNNNRRIEEAYKLSFMTKKYAHVDRANESYYGLSKSGEFLKVNYENTTGSKLEVIPNLSIKNCKFTFESQPSNLIKDIITENRGILILPDGTKKG